MVIYAFQDTAQWYILFGIGYLSANEIQIPTFFKIKEKKSLFGEINSLEVYVYASIMFLVVNTLFFFFISTENGRVNVLNAPFSGHFLLHQYATV